MSAVAFDTLALARNLRDRAHFTQEQAEGVAESINEMMGDQLATKADLTGDIASVRRDLAETEARLRADNASLRTEVQTGFQLLEQRMTIRLGAMIAAGVAFLSAIKFFGH